MILKKPLFFALCFSTLLILKQTVSAQAETSSAYSVKITLKKAVTQALAQNRDLVAAKYVVRQAEGRLRQAGLWPNPALELTGDTDVTFNNEGEYSFSSGLIQNFPISGRLSKAKKVARVDVALAAAEIRNKERLLIGETLGLGRKLLILSEQLKANSEIQATIRKFLKVSKKRLAAAEVSEADVNLLSLELDKAKLAEVSLKNSKDIAIANLKRLLGLKPFNTLKIAGKINTKINLNDVSKATLHAVSRRPDHQLAALAVNRAKAEIKLAKALRWEDWSIGFEYSRDRQSFIEPIGIKQDDFLGLRLSIPLPFWNRRQGSIIEAHATKQKALAELQALELRINTEAHNAENQVRRFLSFLNHYSDKSLKLAEDNVALIHKGYRDGLIGITPLIQAEQQYSEIKESYWEIVGKLMDAKTKWETATASSSFLRE